uniref:Uncharacterized protein n=1 Tax=Setaria italica TaxID=4555 RepID=K3XTP8_SETIT
MLKPFMIMALSLSASVKRIHREGISSSMHVAMY